MSHRSFVKISEFCETGSGTTPSRQKLDRYYGGTIPWVKSGELRESKILATEEHVTREALAETSLRLVPAGALLVAMYGATVGRVGQLGIQATTNQAVCHIVPDQSVADAGYMFHALCAKASELVAKGVGGAQPNISQGTIKDTVVYLPPLDEQKRIAAILDQADALRRKRQRALDRLNQLGQAIFVEMFGDLTKNEKCWPTLSIAKVCEEIVDCVNRTAPLSAEVTDYKMIRTTNVRSGRVDLKSVRYVDFDTFCRWNRRLKPRKGDVLLTREAPVGETGIIRSNDEVFLGQRLMLYRANPRLLTAEFLTYQFQSDFLRSQFSEHSSGSTVKHLSLPACRAFKFRVPPVELQKKFSEQLSATIILEGYAEVCLGGLEDLFTSLQHRAFRGEL